MARGYISNRQRNLNIGISSYTENQQVLEVIGSTNLSGDLNVTGVSTIGSVKISSGIVTASSGIVTYYGDGSNLTGIVGTVNINSNTTNQNQFLTYALSTGSTTGLGVTTTNLVYNPSTNRLGIGTTNPRTTLEVNGVIGFGTFTAFSATRTNIRIGDNTTGANLTSGRDNIFMGIGAGNSTTSGFYNNFFGRRAGFRNTTGTSNNFFGDNAGYYNTTGSFNNFFGNDAGRCNTTGFYNNFFGVCAGSYSTNVGCHNNFFGFLTGFGNSGNNNNFFGGYAGFSNDTGSYNNFFGKYAGFTNNTGSYNNFFGRDAGCCNTTGNNNTFLGAFTGRSSSASNKIILGRGFSSSVRFDSPDVIKSTQFAVGVRTDANPANYWLVGNENFNIGIGTTNPTAKLDVLGSTNLSGDLNVTGVSTIGSVKISSGIVTASSGIVTYYGDGSNLTGIVAGAVNRTIGISIDGGGNVITTGTKGYVEVPYAGSIVEWKIIADPSGSITFDIWKSNATIPTNSNTITASAKPTLTTAQRATSTTLTGWTTGVSVNDVFGFEVESATTITKAVLTLVIQQT